MRNIKIAALQFSCCSQVQENIDKAETMVREAASNGANLILLPELFETDKKACGSSLTINLNIN